ncbi:hypothetical protein SAMN05216526_1883, partial [Ectothiorhodosinus mongolicus]
VDHQPLTFEQAMQQQVAVARIGARQSLETGPERLITGLSSLIPEG